MDNLIKKFIKDSNLEKFKQKKLIVGVILEDEDGDRMLITKPLMTENLITVDFGDCNRTYQYKKGLDNKHYWFIKEN